MCLLDEVVSWDADRITCSSSRHRDAGNPLRVRGQLGVACGIEYAAQAMAVHGALAAGALQSGSQRPPAGFLAGLRGVEFHVVRLDDLPGDLTCDAVRVAGDGGSAIYDFEVRCASAAVLNGRATVVLEAKEWMRS